MIEKLLDAVAVVAAVVVVVVVVLCLISPFAFIAHQNFPIGDGGRGGGGNDDLSSHILHDKNV